MLACCRWCYFQLGLATFLGDCCVGVISASFAAHSRAVTLWVTTASFRLVPQLIVVADVRADRAVTAGESSAPDQCPQQTNKRSSGISVTQM